MKARDDDNDVIADYGQDEYLPLMEAAQLTGRSRWTLYTLVRKGYIETYRVGHRVFVNMGSLCEYFEQREKESR